MFTLPLYDRLRTTSARLLAKYKQGTVEIGKAATAPGADPWDPPTETTVWTEVNAVVKGVSQKYVDGSTVAMSDLEILLQVPATFDEAAGDRVRVDGRVVTVLAVMPIPAAGEECVLRLIVRS